MDFLNVNASNFARTVNFQGKNTRQSDGSRADFDYSCDNDTFSRECGDDCADAKREPAKESLIERVLNAAMRQSNKTDDSFKLRLEVLPDSSVGFVFVNYHGNGGEDDEGDTYGDCDTDSDTEIDFDLVPGSSEESEGSEEFVESDSDY